MAHIGEECGLCAACGFGLQARFVQFVLALDSLGDVQRQRHCIAFGRPPFNQPDELAVPHLQYDRLNVFHLATDQHHRDPVIARKPADVKNAFFCGQAQDLIIGDARSNVLKPVEDHGVGLVRDHQFLVAVKNRKAVFDGFD